MSIKEKEFTDRDGRKRQRTFPGGITENTLIEPSQWYIENVLEPTQAMQKRVMKQQEKEAKIKAKLREMAEKELEKK